MRAGILFNNRILDVVFIAWFLAQGYKFARELIVNRRIDLNRIWGTGGMPSSHSSTVTSLTTAIGIVNGYGSTFFALSLTFAGIVMYDAAGIRRSAGKQAAIINRLLEKIHQSHFITGVHEEKLKELLGHTPFEVLVGGVLGVLVSYVFKDYLLG
ncbi:MAG: divergent PAP2 family protein [Fusobacteriaceae bacterium]